MIRTKPAPGAAKTPATKKPAGKSKPAAKPKSKAKPKVPGKPKEPAAKAAPAQKPDPQATAQPQRDGRDRTGDRKLEVNQVIAALKKTAGLKAAAARELNVARNTLYKFLDENEIVEETLNDIDEEIKDLAESKLIQLLKAGDPQTIRWYLELKGKDRGYVRRIENTGKNGGPMEVAQKVDLSQLTDEELEILDRAAQRRENQTVGK